MGGDLARLRSMGEVTAIGEVLRLERDGVRAEIGTVAAVLAGCWVGGHAIAEPFDAASVPPGGCGIVLVPWPNRVRDGRWMLDGAVQQLDLTEPSLGNASHGLLRNTAYAVLERAADAVTLGALVPQQHGWPFSLDTLVRYGLTDDGITVTHSVQNVGRRRAPVAVGAHPYLRVGEQPVGELRLTVPAARAIMTDERNLPVGEEAVDGTGNDLRAGAVVGGLDLNVALFELTPGPGGELARLDGAVGSTSLWADADFGYLQAYTNRGFPNGESLGLALEPMTAPADALNSGRGLRWLEPGERWELRWGIRFTAAS